MIKMFVESVKNLVSSPDTIKYPFAPSPEPKGYRGTILYNEELCIFCDKCENICPPGAIKFEVVDIESGKKQYNYNPYLCIYCGACVDVCPKAEEGCLIQAEVRTPVMGESVVKNSKLGYFINTIELDYAAIGILLNSGAYRNIESGFSSIPILTSNRALRAF